VLVARWPGRAASALEAASMTTYALPGIVVALAVVFLALGAFPLLYQTFLLLSLAYALRFLPQALGPLRDGLTGISPSLEESARVLGRTPLATFRLVTVPLLRPAVVAAAALVFLTTAKELPMTLILAPTGFGTLATQVWGAVGEGFYARAAPSALLLVALSLGSVALLLRGEERA
jgi:iron(III) transport system permease protein